MIQTKAAFFYEDRGDKIAKIKIEIESFIMDFNGATYKVNDWAIAENGTKTLYKTKEVRYTNETINNLDAHIVSTNDFTGMSKTQIEWKKMQLALMMDTKTNLLASGTTIYRLNPTDWEFMV